MTTQDITITVTGYIAHLIERANRASFYGVYGNTNASAEAMRACCNAIEDYIIATSIPWQTAQIMTARTIDTTGTPIPYKAEITARIEA